MNYQPLKYIYQHSGNPSSNTLLLLHGTGGDENDLLPLSKNFGNGNNVLSLRGNVSEGGMPRFFKRLGMGVFDEQDLEFRTHEMVAFLKDLAEKEGFDINKIVALGYSNGANIAGGALAMYPGFLAGAILYRPMQPFKNLDIKPAGKFNTPIFFSTGKMDPTINPAATLSYVKLLTDAGFDVTHKDLPASHNLIQEDFVLSIEWYEKYFQNK